MILPRVKAILREHGFDSEPVQKWESVAKARKPEEDSAVDAVDAFLLYTEGWLLDPETHRLRHPEKHPMWTTLGGALDYELTQPDPLPDPPPHVGAVPAPPDRPD